LEADDGCAGIERTAGEAGEGAEGEVGCEAATVVESVEREGAWEGLGTAGDADFGAIVDRRLGAGGHRHERAAHGEAVRAAQRAGEEDGDEEGERHWGIWCSVKGLVMD
jgi:hypothetical protein